MHNDQNWDLYNVDKNKILASGMKKIPTASGDELVSILTPLY